MKTILIAGGTGFIGRQLAAELAELGYQLRILFRNKIDVATGHPNINYFQWDPSAEYIDSQALKGVDVIINLTGANIGDKPWTNKRKKELYDSRILTTRLLHRHIKKLNIELELYIGSSATGYYGMVTSEHLFTETDPPENDFLGQLVQDWEDESLKFSNCAKRVILFRKGVVLGPSGGMLKKLKPLASLCINTQLGDGTNYLPWISLKDLIRSYIFSIENRSISGVFNLVSSEHIQQKELCQQLAKSLNRPILTPAVPVWALKLIFKELANLLTKGSRVSNEKLLKNNFSIKDNSLARVFINNIQQDKP